LEPGTQCPLGVGNIASMASTPAFVPLSYQKPSASETATRARQFFERLDRRRSVRAFSDEEVSENVIKDLVRAASTAPSGAHLQPWTFVAVSDPATKRRIRIAAEAEEEKNYASRMPADWLRAVEPMGTNKHKPFLDVAPWVIVLFRQDYGLRQNDTRVHHYYVAESVGIAAGMFLAAVHEAGLVALTHTPSPMRFLRDILDRPRNETATLLIPVGYPADDATVPNLCRKSLDEVLTIV